VNEAQVLEYLGHASKLGHGAALGDESARFGRDAVGDESPRFGRDAAGDESARFDRDAVGDPSQTPRVSEGTLPPTPSVRVRNPLLRQRGRRGVPSVAELDASEVFAGGVGGLFPSLTLGVWLGSPTAARSNRGDRSLTAARCTSFDSAAFHDKLAGQNSPSPFMERGARQRG